MPHGRRWPSVLSAALMATALAVASVPQSAQAQQQSAPMAQTQSQTPSGPASAEVAEIQRLIKSGQHAPALKLIDEALAKNPKDPSMRFRRGVTLSMLDRKPEALSVFQKLVDDHPEMPSPYNNLAVLYGAQGDYDKARAALEKAIRTNPAYATAYQNLGDVYAQLASQAYSRALQLDKSDTTVPPKLALLRELVASPNVPSAHAANDSRVIPPSASRATQQMAAAPAVPVPSPAPTSSLAPQPAPKPAPQPAPGPAPVPAPTPPPSPSPKPSASVSMSAPAQAPNRAGGASGKPVPGATAGNAVAEVETAVRAWAAAWSRRDMANYLGAYTSDFTGQAKSRQAWAEDRRARILPRKRIAVSISELRVSVNGDRAQAHFRQTYESDTLSTSGRKSLELVRSNSGKWLIRQESVGG